MAMMNRGKPPAVGKGLRDNDDGPPPPPSSGGGGSMRVDVDSGKKKSSVISIRQTPKPSRREKTRA
jgi:hypothetical protein